MTRELTEKNSVWYEAAIALRELSRCQPKNDSFVYRMRRLMRVVIPVMEDLEETRKNIVGEYVKKDAEGNPVMAGRNEYVLTDPEACERRVRELMANHTALTVERIRAEELKAEGIKITPDLSYRLGPLLMEPSTGRDGVAEGAELVPAA